MSEIFFVSHAYTPKTAVKETPTIAGQGILYPRIRKAAPLPAAAAPTVAAPAME